MQAVAAVDDLAVAYILMTQRALDDNPGSAHTWAVPYRDEFSANQEQLQQLRRELADTRAELDALRTKYAQARAVLRVVAEGKKVANLLDELRKHDVE